jgi:beta-galactosidase
VAWNAHSPVRGEFRTEAGLDLARFLALVQAAGMHAIVRPGPYICAEWSNGGLPAWLFTDLEVRPRCSEPRYLKAVTEYLEAVYAIVAPLQIDRGGPVILVQIENEYGAYGNDKDYLGELVRVTRAAGITVPLTTIDQPTPQMLAAGRLDGLHMTASFGSRTPERFETLRSFQPTGPMMCMEFWIGWFDSWGTHHHTTSAADSAAELEAILSAGASVNIYMVHGGTNFGLTNGANDKGRYQPIATSYDYDAPLDEAGNPTDKYFAFREVIARYAPVPEEAPVRAAPAPEFEVAASAQLPFFGAVPALGQAQTRPSVPTFDELGQDSGFVLYETDLALPGTDTSRGVLTIGEVRDYALVQLDSVPVGVLSRESHENSIQLPPSTGRPATGRLTVLVEDQGRVDYGSRLGEPKGLIGPVLLDGVPVTGWTVTPLDVDRLPALVPTLQGGPGSGPVVVTAEFELAEPTDLFLDTTTWGKGVAWINDFGLGRYWRRGPQQTLYLPAPATRAGTNRLVLLELEVVADPTVRFVPELRLGYEEV